MEFDYSETVTALAGYGHLLFADNLVAAILQNRIRMYGFQVTGKSTANLKGILIKI